MALRFPGMDPFIEGQVWTDFHHEFIAVLREPLTARLRPRYVVRVEKRVYLEHVPGPDEVREAYLTIRERETMEVVTVIEVLSPGNKRPGSDGRREYLAKREEVLKSATHLVEIDLLRGGERLPTVEPLPTADYYAFVSRGDRRPRVEVFLWGLRERLPSIPVPILRGDPDVSLDLQWVFETVYSRVGYDYSLDQGGPVVPPLPEVEERWVREILGAPGG